jgi:hypothetical protein
MNVAFRQFIDENRAIAMTKAVSWDLPVDDQGVALQGWAWNLTQMVSASPPPTDWLRDLGTDKTTVETLNRMERRGPERTYTKQPLSTEWQDLIKASVIDQLLLRRNTTRHALNNVIRPLRVLGTCAIHREPWKLTADDVALAFDTAKQIQPSGKLADLVFGVVKSLLDPNHLTVNGPLSPTLSRDKKVDQRTSKVAKSLRDIRSDLEERKTAEKLPERRVFWELVRIVFTETPRTFLDLLRFAQVKTMLLTGLRVGEVACLPVDWKRYRQFYDRSGRAAGELGGYSRSLMLRHFAEKQRNMNEGSMALFENVQDIPLMFEEILTETLDRVVAVTIPLRATLKRQVETGRILPQFSQCDLVRAVELYTYLTGNPYLADVKNDLQVKYKAAYQKSWDPHVFDELRNIQLRSIDTGQLREIGSGKLNSAAYMYFDRLEGVALRRRDGTQWQGRKLWDSIYLRVGELEEYLTSRVTTKLSDVAPMKLSDGALAPWELMFLMPKRALGEGSEQGLTDITRHCAVGRMDAPMMVHCLGSNESWICSRSMAKPTRTGP